MMGSGQERIQLRDHFLTLLVKAQGERSRRDDMVPGPDGWKEPGWIVYERQVMFDEVNRLRGTRGRAPVTLKDVMKVEGCASGHVDYSRKYALYCAEIVLGESPNVRE